LELNSCIIEVRVNVCLIPTTALSLLTRRHFVTDICISFASGGNRTRNCNDNREVVGKVHVVVIFGITFAKRGIPLTDFYKIWHGEVFQVCTITPNFTVLAE